MESMAYLNYDSSSPGAEFITDGELRLVQKAPLRHRGHHVIYNVSLVTYCKVFESKTSNW